MQNVSSQSSSADLSVVDIAHVLQANYAFISGNFLSFSACHHGRLIAPSQIFSCQNFLNVNSIFSSAN